MKKKIKKTDSDNIIVVPRRILEKALAFGSLFGSTTTDRIKHAQIPTLKLIFSKGKIKAFGKRKDGLCIFHFILIDKEIKGTGEIYIGDVIKLIGGRDINKNRFTGVIGRLSDLVEISIIGNQVVFDKDKDYDVSISLIDETIAKAYVIDESDFISKVIFKDGEITSLMGDEMKGYCTIKGIHLKEIMEDEKTTNTDFLHFDIKADENSFRMKLGDSERSMRRKIPYVNDEMQEDINGWTYNGIEAFANVLDSENTFDVYFRKDKAFVFYQNTVEHAILLMTGIQKK